MATYVFTASDGDSFEVEASMLNPPAIGSVRYRKGKTFRRMPNVPLAQVAPEIHFDSHSLPLNWKYAPAVNPKNGKPRFTSKQQVTESIARARHAGEPIDYD